VFSEDQAKEASNPNPQERSSGLLAAPWIFCKLQTCTDHLSSPIYSRASAHFLLSSFLFFFILTLIDCAEIMNTAPYNGEPALHIVVLSVMNCPSGPFRS
jgi:hypothetical protein